jgi:hypothetical protein
MTNPLQKYLKSDPPYVQPPLTPRVAQYILKALDYLHIHSIDKKQPALIEQPLHDNTEALITDVIMYAPEEDDNDGQTTG